MAFLSFLLIGKIGFSFLPVNSGVNVLLTFPYPVWNFKISTLYFNYSKFSFGISLLAGEKINFRERVGKVYSMEQGDSIDLIFNFQNNLDFLRCLFRFKPFEKLPFNMLIETDLFFPSKDKNYESVGIYGNDTAKIVIRKEYFLGSPFFMRFALSYKVLDLPLDTELTMQVGNMYIKYLNPLPQRKIKTSFNYPFISLRLAPAVKEIGDKLPREIPFIVGITSIGMSLFLAYAPYINEVPLNERILWGTGAVLSSFGSAYLLSLYKKKKKRNIIGNICMGLITGTGWCLTSSLIRNRTIKYWSISGDYMVREFSLFIIYGSIIISHMIALFI